MSNADMYPLTNHDVTSTNSERIHEYYMMITLGKYLVTRIWGLFFPLNKKSKKPSHFTTLNISHIGTMQILICIQINVWANVN